MEVNSLKEALKEDTILVSIMCVNNETGAINPIKEIGELLKTYPKIAFHVDMTQAIGKVDIPLDNTDMFSFAGHKIHGLLGSGALIKDKKIILEPQNNGGGQENNLRSGQFVIYLQPQVDKDKKIEGAECLVRWILPNGNMVPPFEFIGILEQSDLIASLDRYVWELAVKQLHAWKNTVFQNIYLSVNVSPKDFYYMDVADTIIGLCKKYEVEPIKLHVEITETAVADETQNNKETIERLQKSGFIVEIDDFGKGSSSLSLLKDIKANVLKIDMGFLRQSENNDRGNVILESVIDMAKRLGMEVISEGVETENQLNTLSDLGCDMFQGYYFSKPIPVAAFEEMVKG